MVKFRQVAGNEPKTNWQCIGDNIIAFSRGSKAFIAIVNDNIEVNHEFQTNLPEGVYCDIISGNLERNPEAHCSGRKIEVRGDGKAWISINGERDEDPMIAIHVESKL